MPRRKFDRGTKPRRGFSRGPKFGPRLMKNVTVIDYKDVQFLRHFISERGKIIPRRVSGLSAKQQRQVTRAIKRARNIALLPFTRQ